MAVALSWVIVITRSLAPICCASDLMNLVPIPGVGDVAPTPLFFSKRARAIGAFRSEFATSLTYPPRR